MDNIIAALLNYGIGGVMAGAILWFTRYILTNTIPGLTAEFRATLEAQRKDFTDHLEMERANNERLLNTIQANWNKAIEQLSESISRLEKTVSNDLLGIQDTMRKDIDLRREDYQGAKGPRVQSPR